MPKRQNSWLVRFVTCSWSSSPVEAEFEDSEVFPHTSTRKPSHGGHNLHFPTAPNLIIADNILKEVGSPTARVSSPISLERDRLQDYQRSRTVNVRWAADTAADDRSKSPMQHRSQKMSVIAAASPPRSDKSSRLLEKRSHNGTSRNYRVSLNSSVHPTPGPCHAHARNSCESWRLSFHGGFGENGAGDLLSPKVASPRAHSPVNSPPTSPISILSQVNPRPVKPAKPVLDPLNKQAKSVPLGSPPRAQLLSPRWFDHDEINEAVQAQATRGTAEMWLVERLVMPTTPARF